LEALLLDAYIIEVANQTAGIIVREPDQPEFKFFSAAPLFDALEGVAFPDPTGAERAASHFLKHGSLPRTATAGDINSEAKF